MKIPDFAEALITAFISVCIGLFVGYMAITSECEEKGWFEFGAIYECHKKINTCTEE